MFRTELPLTPHPQQLPHTARVLTIGSCFSDSIGARLAEFKVATLANPFGTVFNPISACKLLRAAAGEDMDWQQHLVEARGRWQSYDLHAEVGANSPVELLQRIQSLTREAGVFLATADVVVLTLGTAYAYRLRETQEIISNCHKVPAEKFEKELLTADDIIAAVAETHAYLRRINPRLRFVLTVSPVRHVKETLVLNSASKAMLRVACHYLSELLPDVSYFPAYELLMDDLRDYRFYASDMLHPSEVAENYIWERFTRTYFDAAFGRFKKEWESIRQALNHRPLHPAAPEHREFLESTLARLQRINGQADVRMEMLHVERELASLPLPTPPPAPEPEEEEDDEERIDIGEGAEPALVATSEPAASLIGQGAGVLLEPETDEDEEEAEPVSSSPDLAYEHAYTAALDEEDASEESETAEAEEPVRKKKRRSRGGAKRTKRKQARLAAEAAATQVAVDTSQAPETASAGPELSLEPAPAPDAPEPAAEVVYITEAELRGENRPAVENSPDADELTSKAHVEVPDEATRPRRSRNNRRGNRQERPADRSRRQPLYAAPQAESAAATPPEQDAPVVAAAEEAPAAPATEAAPVAPVAPVAKPREQAAPEAEAATPTPKKRAAKPRSTRKPTAPAETEAAAPIVLEASAPTEAPAEAPAPAAKAPRSRRRPAPKPAAEAAPEAPVSPAPPAEAPVATETPAKPARSRAPRRKAAPAAPELPAAEEVPAEPAKRKPRAPRRKPAPDSSETA